MDDFVAWGKDRAWMKIGLTPFVRRSSKFRNGRREPDAHEKPCEGLREMLQKGGAEPPPGTETRGVDRQVVVGQAVDFPEVDDERLPVVLRLGRRSK